MKEKIVSDIKRDIEKIGAEKALSRFFDKIEKKLSNACLLCTKGFTEDSQCAEDLCQIFEIWSILGE